MIRIYSSWLVGLFSHKTLYHLRSILFGWKTLVIFKEPISRSEFATCISLSFMDAPDGSIFRVVVRYFELSMSLSSYLPHSVTYGQRFSPLLQVTYEDHRYPKKHAHPHPQTYRCWWSPHLHTTCRGEKRRQLEPGSSAFAACLFSILKAGRRDEGQGLLQRHQG